MRVVLTGLKRWILTGAVGILLIGLGIAGISRKLGIRIDTTFALAASIISGLLLGLIALRELIFRLIDFREAKGFLRTGRNSGRNIISRRILLKGPKIVVIGGGTGLSVLLRGLKQLTSNITAVVTVADDGGGSGKLRTELGMLPPGDVRNCILALADTEPVMEQLLQYRFQGGYLKGGNLFIAAMNGISGNFEKAVRKISQVLAVTGQVLPITLEDVTLYAQLRNGRVIKGESSIPEWVKNDNSPIQKVFLKPQKPEPLPEVLEAVRSADAIVLGPGSLYTSIIPNLLAQDMAESIAASDAVKIYVANIMTQPYKSAGRTCR